MKTFTVTQNQSLKDFTDCTYPQGGFCFAQLLKNKDIKVNGARVSGNVALKTGDEVVFYTAPKQEEMKSHGLVFEDENVCIADKYSGVNTEGLLSELQEKGEFYAVHRLDRNTQGVIVFAKNKAAEAELLSAFKERRVIKTYVALCKNRFMAESAILTAYLKKDERTSFVKVYDKEVSGSVKIITQYSLVENRGDIALVRITLHTGRTHQIRAHFAHIGCPVLGDEKYGDEALNKKYGLKRQCLISKRLAFCLTGKLSYLNGKSFISRFDL
ncbi:MAG: RluA family pseudouridine synthase [Clostridia bacterium]|nr:RluA family pseudouridine synthase [Clostridia bacterium]